VVAHSCNPSYKGGRDGEDQGSTPVLSTSPPTKKEKKGKKPTDQMGKSPGSWKMLEKSRHVIFRKTYNKQSR
jgi:hypothetical protein